MALTLNDFLRYLGVILLLINTFLYLKSYGQHKKTIAFQILLLYLIVNALLQTILVILNYYGENNLYLSHFYFTTQFVIISAFYITIFKKLKQYNLIKLLLVIVISILSIQYIINPLALFRFNLLEVFLTSFPLIVYSIIHLYNSLTTKGKYLYFNAAILIYLTSSTLIFILGNYITIAVDREIARNIWIIHKALNIIFTTLIFLEWKNSFSSYKTKVQS